MQDGLSTGGAGWVLQVRVAKVFSFKDLCGRVLVVLGMALAFDRQGIAGTPRGGPSLGPSNMV